FGDESRFRMCLIVAAVERLGEGIAERAPECQIGPTAGVRLPTTPLLDVVCAAVEQGEAEAVIGAAADRRCCWSRASCRRSFVAREWRCPSWRFVVRCCSS